MHAFQKAQRGFRSLKRNHGIEQQDSRSATQLPVVLLTAVTTRAKNCSMLLLLLQL
jgi:hypothetical protein